ncbi:hypothetical protein [Streptomyces otsuchiensis]|uniref:hypothetical protein n=1 Tax=Streptomyces otsuchiensis TaxID=2681388 RepID=UPI00102FD6C0|nr:hypothetical protein [Streptomyces otsuchiensis]
MVQTLIAVTGTLAAAILTQLVAARTARRATLRADQLAAVTGLASALADHRRTMWCLMDARLAGRPDDEIAQRTADTHTTRAAITGPAMQVRVLLPAAVAAAAQAAIADTYEIRDALDAADLAARREAALAAAERCSDTAADHLQHAH